MKSIMLPTLVFGSILLQACAQVLSLDDASVSHSENQLNAFSLESEVDITQRMAVQDFKLSRNITINRNLQECSTIHDGTYFNNMFFEGDQWLYDSFTTPNRVFWHDCDLHFGRPLTKTFNALLFVYLPSGSDTYRYQQFGGYAAVRWRFNDYHAANPNDAAANCRVRIEYDGITATVTSTSLDVLERASNTNTNNLINDMYEFAIRKAVLYIVKAHTHSEEITKLLDNRPGILYGKDFSKSGLGEVKARIATKHQIRIFDPYPDTYHYLNRKIVNKDSSSYSLSSYFSSLHKEVGGGNNPPFGICHTGSPSRVFPEDSQVAFCCDGQCTDDVTSEPKIWVSSSCDVVINDCYNTLLTDCVVEKKQCEHLITDPNDEILEYRAQLPQKNTWVFYAREEMTGGGINSHGYRFSATGRSIIDGHHSIDFEGAGHGNGRYKVTFRLQFGLQYMYDRYPDPDKKLLDLVVYSHATNEELAKMTLTMGGLNEMNEYSLEVLLQEKHLGDIAFRNIPYTNEWLKYDFARVEFLRHETLPPTPAPTNSPTLTSTWSTLYSHGAYGTFQRSEEDFNDFFHRSETSIIRRVCYTCKPTHREIYYKRLTDKDTFLPYTYMINYWRSANNLLNVDFELYSTLADALAGTNRWQYCDYMSYYNGVGFPRNCGPTGAVYDVWNP